MTPFDHARRLLLGILFLVLPFGFRHFRRVRRYGDPSRFGEFLGAGLPAFPSEELGGGRAFRFGRVGHHQGQRIA